MTTLRRLDNGLTVIAEENRFAPVVSMGVWVNIGSADETDAEAGLAHVHEHMVFKGTERLKVGEIARSIEAAGGDINAYTSFDHTVYYITMASRYFETGLTVLADAVQHAAFDADELKKELQVILEEVKRYNDMPASKLSTKLFEKAFTTHPFRRPIIGFEDTIANFSRDDVLLFFNRYYVPSNMTFVIAGDIDEEKAVAKVADAFSSAPSTPVNKPVRLVEPPQDGTRSFVMHENVTESFLDLGFHIPGILHDDTPALDLLGVILGNGESSRLYRAVKADAELVHSVWSYAYTPSDAGIFVAGAALSAKKATEATARTLEVIYGAGAGVTEVELAKARRTIEADFVFERETVQGHGRRLGYFWTVVKDLDFEEKYLAKVAAVTPDDIARAAKKYLTPSNLTVGLLLPREWKDKYGDAELQAAIASAGKPVVAAEPGDAVAAPPPVVPAKPESPLVASREESQGVVRFVLHNGVRVLYRRNPAVPLFAARAIWLGGSRFETDETQGISSMMAGLFSKGAGGRSAADFAGEVEALGGSVKGFSGRNTFGVNAEFLSRDFARGFSLMADVIRGPAFDESEFEKRRADVLFHINRRKDELARYVFDLFSAELYRKHPYRFPVLGSEKSVTAMTRDGLADFFRRYAVPENLVLSVVGDLDEDEVIGQAEALLGDLPKGAFDPPVPPIEEAPDGIRRVEETREKEQAHLMIGFPGTTMKDPDRYPLEVLNSILAGQSGRLFIKLRDEMNLAYTVAPFTAEGIETGYFCVYIGTSPGNVEVAIENILDQLERVRTEEVTQAELERAQRHMVGSYEVDLQSNSSQASNFGFNEAYDLGYASYREYPEKVKAVTRADVARVAKRFLTTDRYTLALVRP